MKKNNEITAREKIKRIYVICVIVLLIVFLIDAGAYVYAPEMWKVWIATLILFILSIGTVIYFFVDWRLQIKELINEYKENNNLLSGGLGYFLTFFLVVLVLVMTSTIPNFPEDAKNALTTIIGFFVAGMPAFIGLLGVKYSVVVQERNRKEDLRVDSKPFLAVKCSNIKMVPENESEDIHKILVLLEIKNISNNIAMLSKISSNDSKDSDFVFSYCPLAHNEKFVDFIELESEESYKDTARFTIKYSDIYQNVYLLTVEILLKDIESKVEIKMISDLLEKEII